ncbi:MAG: pentapeptide repeat-containing protein [Beijerinckiaceae bacterium]
MTEEILPRANESLSAAEKFAGQAHDLDALRKAVVDAASVGEGIWLSYLFVLLYIAIAAGGVTHRDLLLESAVKMPFLGVELPLVAFFFLAPILFIVSHGYTLVHFVMLAAKVGKFEEELRKQLPGALETWEGLRRQLPSNIFVQFLAGPSDIRKGGVGLLLKAIAWITLVIGPVLLLLLIQAQFLPYHLSWITWVQRFAVVIDVILLWLLWPAVLDGRSTMMWRLQRRGKGWPAGLALAGRYIAALTACLVPIGLVFTAATFPGEWLDEHIGTRQWIPPNPVTELLGAKNEKGNPLSTPTSFHDLLFNGAVDNVTRRRRSLFSNTLILPEFDALEAVKIDDQKLGSVKQTLSLRGRHLEGAIFYFADLRKADLREAYLQGASLFNAKLQGTWFYQAQLQGADLSQAKLLGASLDNAWLQGASLEKAELQGALVNNARLQGAKLDKAQLQGANLSQAHLQGASLRCAKLQGADFAGPKVVDTNVDTHMRATNLRAAKVWRTHFKDESLADVLQDSLDTKAFSKPDFDGLRTYMDKQLPAGIQRDPALDLIKKLDPGEGNPEASQIPALEKGRAANDDAYQKALADELKKLVCSGDTSASYIVQRLVETGRIADTGPYASRLIDSILAPACPVSLTEQDKAKLQEPAKKAQAGECEP